MNGALRFWSVQVASLLVMLSGSAISARADVCDDHRSPILPQLEATPTRVVSTVPTNGDVNPYGVAFVPPDVRRGGALEPGDILVSNFNDVSNTQGTGTTIVRISERGEASLFFEGAPGLGLTTALAVLPNGYVIVGNLPSPTGTCTGDDEEGVGRGSLLIINRHGRLAHELHSAHFYDGPWDLTLGDVSYDEAQVFVSSVRSGTVTRVVLDFLVGDDEHGDDDDVEVADLTQIASGYVHRCDPAALVVGPTGLAFDPHCDVLYVASTGDNAVYAVRDAGHTQRDAGTGDLFIKDDTHMHGPLGLVRADNGDLLVSQGDAVNPDANHPSEIVEYSSFGRFVAELSVDPAAGSAFGMALARAERGFVFAAVDDGTNELDIWRVK